MTEEEAMNCVSAGANSLLISLQLIESKAGKEIHDKAAQRVLSFLFNHFNAKIIEPKEEEEEKGS